MACNTGIYIPTLANQIMLANSERESAGLPPSINLRNLGIGNGCSGTESASCGSRPSAETFSETGEGITLRFLKDHALLSTDVYESVQSACGGVTGATPLDRYEDCYEDVAWDAVAEPHEAAAAHIQTRQRPTTKLHASRKTVTMSALSLIRRTLTPPAALH